MAENAEKSDKSFGEQAASHAVALLLTLAAAAAALWFYLTNRQLLSVFPSLFRRFQWGGAPFDASMLLWGLGAVAVFVLVGWFLLECFEIYLPRSALAALAFVFGMGLCGFLFEVPAMAGRLVSPWVFGVPAFLILLLWPFAIRAARRRPETGEGGEGSEVEQGVRRYLARERFRHSLIVPQTFGQQTFFFLFFALIALITAAIFYHALLYPETYWDSLILYLGYARMMYLEEGIVRKVTGQVGIGLGANYPHLYALLGAGISAAADQWSDLPQRLIAPLCGLASTVLVYRTVLYLSRHVNFSLAMTLLYRSIPLGIAYDQYASDYALVVLFAAAFLYLAVHYIDTLLRGYFVLATLSIALAMHLNYLMGILWLPWGLMLIAAHVRRPTPLEADAAEEEARKGSKTESPVLTGWDEGRDEPPPWTYRREAPPLFRFIASRTFIATLGVCVVIASTWYIRNWIVTGNPVYAFFYEILGGKRINPEVMKSAEAEWAANGAGIARMGDTVGERLRNSWIFFVDTAAWRPAYRLQPVFPGFVVPGILVLLARAVAAPFVYRRCGGRGVRFFDTPLRFGLVALVFTLALFAFHYAMAPFYLYQIILFLPAFAILASMIYPWHHLRIWRVAMEVVIIAVGICPGLAMALMGMKIFGPVRLGPERYEAPWELAVFRRPSPPPEVFYSWRFGEDPDMWHYVNRRLKGQKLLTHENRHLVFDPSITLVHLDDWEIQQLWELPPREKINALKKMGIHYYLRVPNEQAHRINRRMGAGQWEALGLATLEYEAGENRLYRLH